MLVWLCSASKPSSSFFHLKDSEAKGGFRKHVNYPRSSVGPLWAGHHKERSALGEPIRHPSTAILPWTDVLPTVRHRGARRLPGTASPLPCRPWGMSLVSHSWGCQLHSKAVYSSRIVLSGNAQLTALLLLACGVCPLP